MRTIVFLLLAFIVVQGCSPERQPPPKLPKPVTRHPTQRAANVSLSDSRAMQTLHDLGVSPEVMLQLVRNHLAATVTNTVAPDPQPPATPIAEELPMVAEPAPAPIPAVQSPEPAPLATSSAIAWHQGPAPASATPQPAIEEMPNAAVVEQMQPAAVAAPAPVAIQQPVEVQQVQDFYAPLNNYGAWVDLPVYGRVWQPAITITDTGWRPYCHGGHWVYTDCGWYWQSDYSWGWAVFHYGRWCYMDRYRWVWLPDTVWAPAWVSWRCSETHCGWAPLPPGTTFRVGVGFNFGPDEQFDLHFRLAATHYTFVPVGHFGDRDLVSVTVGANRLDEVYRGTTHVDLSHTWNAVDHRVHNDGPGREWSEHTLHHQPAQPIRIVTRPTAPEKWHAPEAPHPLEPRHEEQQEHATVPPELEHGMNTHDSSRGHPSAAQTPEIHNAITSPVLPHAPATPVPPATRPIAHPETPQTTIVTPAASPPDHSAAHFNTDNNRGDGSDDSGSPRHR